MHDWKAVTEFTIGPVKFYPDGTIDPGLGTKLPASAKLINMSAGDVTLDKPLGEAGEEVTVRTSDGALSAKWDGGAWQIRGDLVDQLLSAAPAAPAGSIPFTTPPGNPAAIFPVPPDWDPDAAGSRTPKTPLLPLLATLVMLLIMGMFTVVAFKPALLSFAEGWTAVKARKAHEVEAEAQRERRETEYRALEREVQAAHVEASHMLAEMEQASSKLATECLDTLGFSLDRAGSDENMMPREIDIAILDDIAFSEAWSRLLNAYLSRDMLDGAKETLDSITKRQQEHALGGADPYTLSEITARLKRGLASLDEQKADLRVVRDTLLRRRQNERNP